MTTLVFTCGGCPTRWTGQATCHCAACHYTFTGLSAFDRHRKEFTCRPPAEVGLVEHERGGSNSPYVAWGRPGDDDNTKRFTEYHTERTNGQTTGEVT